MYLLDKARRPRIIVYRAPKYIADELGNDYLNKVNAKSELRSVKKEISELQKKLRILQDRKNILEESLKK